MTTKGNIFVHHAAPALLVTGTLECAIRNSLPATRVENWEALLEMKVVAVTQAQNTRRPLLRLLYLRKHMHEESEVRAMDCCTHVCVGHAEYTA